jgi:hypothetical protein
VGGDGSVVAGRGWSFKLPQPHAGVSRGGDDQGWSGKDNTADLQYAQMLVVHIIRVGAAKAKCKRGWRRIEGVTVQEAEYGFRQRQIQIQKRAREGQVRTSSSWPASEAESLKVWSMSTGRERGLACVMGVGRTAICGREGEVKEKLVSWPDESPNQGSPAVEVFEGFGGLVDYAWTGIGIVQTVGLCGFADGCRARRVGVSVFRAASDIRQDNELRRRCF